MADLCHDLVGPDARLYWDQSVYKRPHGAEPVLWHQDNGYTYIEPQAYLTVWVALTDATPENGCVQVLPGRAPHRHRRAPQHADRVRVLSRSRRRGRGAGARRRRRRVLARSRPTRPGTTRPTTIRQRLHRAVRARRRRVPARRSRRRSPGRHATRRTRPTVSSPCSSAARGPDRSPTQRRRPSPGTGLDLPSSGARVRFRDRDPRSRYGRG